MSVSEISKLKQLKEGIDLTMEFGIVGTSIWQQNMPLLARLSLDKECKSEKLQQLKSLLEVEELIYLSTCNRVEFIYVVSPRNSSTRILHRIIDFFFSRNRDLSFFPNDFYQYNGRDAIRHLFRTVASLDSLVIGETQITGQFKQAYQEALDSGLADQVLDGIAREALATAKKVKRETTLGAGALSMATLATEELKIWTETKKNSIIALVGAGVMTEKLAKYITESLDAKPLFVNRTFSESEKLAAGYDTQAISLESFLKNPPPVSAIVSATAAPEPIFNSSFLKKMQSGSNCTLCIDLAMPPDFSEDFKNNNSVRLIDIGQFKSRGQNNLRQKFIEAGHANEIIRNCVSKYLADQIELSIKPIFQKSHRDSIEMARKAFDDLFSRKVTTLPEKDRHEVIQLMTKLIGFSSYQPVKTLSNRLVQLDPEINLFRYKANKEKSK